MTALRVGRSKIISNAIVPPSGHHFPSPWTNCVSNCVLYAGLCKIRGGWSWKSSLVTICKFHYFSVELFCFQDNCIFGDVYKNSGIVKYFKSVLRIETLKSLQFEIKYKRIFYYRNLWLVFEQWQFLNYSTFQFSFVITLN